MHGVQTKKKYVLVLEMTEKSTDAEFWAMIEKIHTRSDADCSAAYIFAIKNLPAKVTSAMTGLVNVWCGSTSKLAKMLAETEGDRFFECPKTDHEIATLFIEHLVRTRRKMIQQN